MWSRLLALALLLLAAPALADVKEKVAARLPDGFYADTLEKERAGESRAGPICERRREIVIQLTISLQSHNVPRRSPRFGNIQPKSQG